ncbi:hypothetical protein GGX14DRAFT_580107 [Mycena pura]|uniref:CxC5 like cysteine cluster associated with KDZ domain-containing protein n=1 Tax=Mycena pura TaxID=153505 RepID=A0AAD6ULZ0_9AGAR|nr:hypothetical protein GGX14DRAFT_580107 [Mycena pura]
MSCLDEIFKFLSQVPGLKESVGMDKAMSFVRIAARLKDEIIVAQPPTYDPSTAPSELPEHVRSFLGGATDMPDEFVAGCWSAFSQTIWMYEQDGSSAGKDAKMFREFGLDHLLCIGAYALPANQDKDGLKKVVLFTLSDVSDGIRTYYTGVPDAIQVGEHQYIEREVLSLFIGLMLISWTSATNAARVYDACLSKSENRPIHEDWPPERSFKMRTEHVWDGFLLLSLLEDYDERKQVLCVPDTGEQSARFIEAIRERNARFRLAGQPEWSHYCDKCMIMRVWQDGNELKKLHVVNPLLAIGIASVLATTIDIISALSKGVRQPTAKPQRTLKATASYAHSLADAGHTMNKFLCGRAG